MKNKSLGNFSKSYTFDKTAIRNARDPRWAHTQEVEHFHITKTISG